MQWAEITVQVKAEAADVTAEILRTLGADNGVEIYDVVSEKNAAGTALADKTDKKVVAYYPWDQHVDQRLKDLQEQTVLLEVRTQSHLIKNIFCRRIDESGWLDNWKKYFHVQHVGRRLVICPAWEEYTTDEGEVLLKVDPGNAFGSGTHQTTALCLEALEQLVDRDMTVFDVGTGSGILAMAAAKLGASQVRAVDISPVAVKTAAANVTANQLQAVVKVKEGDLLHGAQGQADLIVANLLADIIINLLPDIPAKLRPQGYFLASGIIEERLQDVVSAAALQNLSVTQLLRKDGWTAVVFKVQAYA